MNPFALMAKTMCHVAKVDFKTVSINIYHIYIYIYKASILTGVASCFCGKAAGSKACARTMQPPDNRGIRMGFGGMCVCAYKYDMYITVYI